MSKRTWLANLIRQLSAHTAQQPRGGRRKVRPAVSGRVETLEPRVAPAVDLIPFTFSGRSDHIVISNVSGTTVDNSPILTSDTVFVDVGVLNNGNTSTGVGYSVSIQLDGNTPVTISLGASNAGFGFAPADRNFGSLTAGIHTLTLTVDSGNVIAETNEANNVYVRQFVVGDVDLGDAPTSLQSLFPGTYPTLLADSGARHTVVSGFSIGAAVEGDLNGQPNLAANRDDSAGTSDEDGVTFSGSLLAGQAGSVSVVVTNTAALANPHLDAWIDFNRDGDWADAGENIFSGAATAGTNTLNFTTPGGAVAGGTYARFRLYNGTTALPVDGAAASGEVQDHAVVILPALGVWQDQGPTSTQNAQVENVTPNNQVTGAIHTVLPHPTNANIMYVGTVNGGVWKTTNATATNPTWVPQTDFLGSLAIGALAFDPTDATFNTLVAGTAQYSSFAGRGGDRGPVYRTTDGGANWTTLASTGLKTFGENISGIAVRGSTIVVTSSVNSGGIFRSTDGGANFAAIDSADFLSPNDNFTDLVADPSDVTGMRLYASLESTGGQTGSSGIYRSDNFGLTWTKVTGAGINSAMHTLLASSNNIEMTVHPTTGRLYVAVLVSAQPRGIFYSDNASSGSPTWTQMDIPILPVGSGTALTNATNATPIVITATAHGLSTGHFVIVSGVTGNTAANGFFRVTRIDADSFSLDASVGNGAYAGGGTWTRVTGPSPTPKEVEETGAQGRIHFSIVVDPTNHNILYVGGDRQEQPNQIGDNTFGGAIFRGDASITRDPNVAPSPQWDHITHDQVAFDPAGGTASGSSPHADSREMAFDAAGNLIETDDGGIYKRTNPRDNTGDWFSLSGTLGVIEFHDIAYDSLTNVLIGGTQDNGTHYQQTEGGSVWSFLSGGDGGDVAIDNVTLAGSNQSIRYASSQNLLSFTRSVWDRFNNRVSTTTPTLTLTGGGNAIVRSGASVNTQFKTPFEINAINPLRLIIGGSTNLWESSNQADNVTNISSAIGINQTSPVAYGGRRLGADNEEVLYVGSGSSVFVRQSGTGAPVAVTDVPGTDAIQDIVLDPADWMKAFVVDSNSVFQTSNAGGAWGDITGNLMSLAGTALTSIEYIPGPVGALVVGGNLGVFTSLINNLGVWTEVGSNLPNALIYDMKYNATDDVLVVGTLGRGAWSIPNASDFLGGNSAPVLAGTSAITFTEHDSATPINTSITVSDADHATLASATVTLTTFVAGQDSLAFTNIPATMGNIAVTGNTGGVLTLTSAGATATLLQWQTALRAVTYANSSHTPTTTQRSVAFVVNDGTSASNVVTSTINVTAVNDVPVATASSVTTNEDTAKTFAVSDFPFTDAEGNSLASITISGLALTGGDTLTVNTGTVVAVTNGLTITAAQIPSMTYTPLANASGSPRSTFNFTVNDANLGVVSATMSINVTAVNDVPVASASSVTTDEDTAKTFAVSDFQFTDAESNPLVSVTITSFTLASGDTLKLSGTDVTANQTITAANIPNLVYNPAGQQNGAARSTFNFRVNDAGLGTVAATMTINVTAVNDIPAATASSVTTNEDTAKTFAVSDFLFNDIEGNSLVSITISSLTLASGDTLKLSGSDVTANQTITAANIPNLVYAPAGNANGAARSTFNFRVNDADSGTVAATMTINVTAVNDVPVASASSVTTNEDTAKTFAVSDFLFNDPEGNGLVSITVSGLSLAGGDTLTVNTGTVVAVANGMVITAAQIPTLTYTPLAGGNGTPRSTFNFTVNDSGLGTVSATMSINVSAVNNVPVASPGSVTTNEDTARAFAVSDFLYTDAESDGLASITISGLTLAGGDTLTVNTGTVVAVANGMVITAAQIPSLTYTPALNASGAGRSTFNFTVNDAGIGTVAAAMTINVTAVNDRPQAVASSVTTAEDGSKSFSASDFLFTDVESNGLASITVSGLALSNGDTLTADIGSGTVTVTNGMTISAAQIPSLTYTPAANVNGSALSTFDFTVNDADNGLTSATMTINVTEVNDAPDGEDDSLSAVGEDSGQRTISFASLLGNDSRGPGNEGGQTLTITNVGSAVGGTVSISGTDVLFTPTAEFNGTASFVYTLRDDGTTGGLDNFLTSTATASFTVSAVNDLPEATAGSVTTEEDTAKTFAVSDFPFTDVESDSLVSITVSGLNLAAGDTLMVDLGSGPEAVADGMTITAIRIPSLTYTPASNATGDARSTFDFKVNDADNGLVAATMTINVTLANDAPEALASSVTTVEDTAKTFAVSDFQFTDTEGNALASITISGLTLAGGDTLTVNTGTVVAVTNGLTITAAQIPTLTYTPLANGSGAPRSTFNFTVNDSEPGMVSATMSINVTAVNDPPTATASSVTTNEDTVKTFTESDFPFTDVETDGLASITVSGLSLAAGDTLTVNTGTVVSVTNGMVITAAQIPSLTYTPAPQANGAARSTFNYKVNDADNGLVAAMMTINVTAVNDPPVITGEPYTIAYSNAMAVNTVLGTITVTDADPGDTRLFSFESGNDDGYFAIDPNTGAVTLANPAMATGDHSLVVRVTDGGALFDETTVTIIRNDLPTTTGIPDQSRNEDETFLTLDLKDFFADTETADANLVFTVVSNTAVGIVTSPAPVGSVLTLTPQADQNGRATIVVRATDEAGLSVTDSFNVDVTPVNDQPTLANIVSPPAVDEDAVEQSVTLSGVTPGLPVNESGQDLIVSAEVTSGNLALLSNVSVTESAGVWSVNYTPTADANGTAVVTVTVEDDGGIDNNGSDRIQKTFTVTVNAVNDAPVTDTDPGMIVDIIPAKALLASIKGSPVSVLTANVTDADDLAVKGIAITSAPELAARGHWEFSTDDGVFWSPISGVDESAALLLADIPGNRVRFVPNAKFTGFASLEYKAWDMTADIGTTGIIPSFGNTILPGQTAYSSEIEKASAAVGKTTPEIDRNGNPLFKPVLKDTKNPAGDLVKTLLGLLAFDNDKKNVLGLAITSADNANGQWQYMAAGKWADITGVSDTSALLLAPTTKARFLPDAGYFGEATLGYHAWDQSVGKNGERAIVAGTAFSTDEDFAAIHVLAKPVLDTSVERTLTAVVPTAVVADLLAGSVSDVLPGESVGIAVTGTTGKGTWTYRIGVGSPVAIKATVASAILLPANAVLEFAPANGFAGLATLSYRAWNSTTLPGAAGSKANASGNAFGAATETLSRFFGGNLSPAIGTTAVNLGKITEDPKTNAGVTVRSLVTSAKITDANKTDKKGIALTNAGNSNGTWQYALDGKTWLAVGTPDVNNALALADTAKLRFVPVVNYNGPATIDFKAWDGTVGVSGDIVDAAVGTAFSTGVNAFATGTLEVSSVNDPPVLDNTGVRFLPKIEPGETSDTVTVASLVAGATDTETPAVEIGIAISVATGPGKWQVSDDGVNFSDLTGLPVVVSPTAVLRFVSDGTKPGLAGLTYQAWDSSGVTAAGKPKADSVSVAKETLTLEVGNIAPTLGGPGTLTTIKEDPKTNTGDTVAKFLGTTFADTAVGKKGIAVTGVDAKAIGEWQYSLNAGKTWAAITGPSETTALLLADTAKIRFVPAKDAFADFVGDQPTISYKAWDQTVGASGEKADTTDDDLNAFSVTPEETAQIEITAVFDAPTLNTGLAQLLDDTASVSGLLAGAVSSPETSTFGIAVTGLTGKGEWRYSEDGFLNSTLITRASATAAVLIPSTATLRFEPAGGFTGLATLSYKAWDATNGNLSGTVNTNSATAKQFFSTAIETLSVFVGNSLPTLETL